MKLTGAFILMFKWTERFSFHSFLSDRQAHSLCQNKCSLEPCKKVVGNLGRSCIFWPKTDNNTLLCCILTFSWELIQEWIEFILANAWLLMHSNCESIEQSSAWRSKRVRVCWDRHFDVLLFLFLFTKPVYVYMFYYCSHVWSKVLWCPSADRSVCLCAL